MPRCSLQIIILANLPLSNALISLYIKIKIGLIILQFFIIYSHKFSEYLDPWMIILKFEYATNCLLELYNWKFGCPILMNKRVINKFTNSHMAFCLSLYINWNSFDHRLIWVVGISYDFTNLLQTKTIISIFFLKFLIL